MFFLHIKMSKDSSVKYYKKKTKKVFKSNLVESNKIILKKKQKTLKAQLKRRPLTFLLMYKKLFAFP